MQDYKAFVQHAPSWYRATKMWSQKKVRHLVNILLRSVNRSCWVAINAGQQQQNSLLVLPLRWALWVHADSSQIVFRHKGGIA